MWPFRSNNAVGLDIGAYSIKFVELDETSKGYKLKNLGIIRTPPESIVDGEIINTPAVGEAIRTLLKEKRVKTKNVVIGVGGHAGVMPKKVKVPIMSREELENHIKWEAEQHIPSGLTIDEVYMDFVILDTLHDEGQMEVSLIFAKKDLVNNYVALIKELGYEPVVVDYNVFALQNCFRLNYSTSEEETVALLDIGASMYLLNVIKGDKSLHVRDVARNAGNQITEELQKNLGLDYEDADEMKKKYGKEGSEISGDAEKIIKGATAGVIENIVREIKRVFVTLPEDSRVSKIYLSGGTPLISGFVDMMKESTEMEVEFINPFKQISIPPKGVDTSLIEENPSVFSIAVGLAMRKPYE
jgi:type IV pilus assembly protein PilM